MSIGVVMPIGPGPQPFVAEAVSSVLASMDVAFRLILVLDGRAQLPSELEDSKLEGVQVVRNTGSRGIASAMNVGVAHCAEEFIAVMHADDIMHHHRLSLQVEALRTDKSLVALGTVVISHEQVSIECFPPNSDYNNSVKIFSESEILASMPLVNPTTVFRRSCFDEIGGYLDGLTSMEDYEFLLRLGTLGQIGILGQPLLAYRLHPNQQSRKHRALTEWNHVLRARLLYSRSKGLRDSVAIYAHSRFLVEHMKASLQYRSKIIRRVTQNP